jgi:hypothetical protein
MELEFNFQKLYNNISFINKNNTMISNVSKILSKEESKHVGFYKNLIANSKDDKIISAEMYNFTKNMINEFKKELDIAHLKNVKDLIKLAIKFEE